MLLVCIDNAAANVNGLFTRDLPVSLTQKYDTSLYSKRDEYPRCVHLFDDRSMRKTILRHLQICSNA
jgi:hypothetical protein